MNKALYNTNKDIPQDMLLGNLVFMNLVDMKIPATDLMYIFKTNNIPEEYVRKISAADAYRRASSDLKGRKVSWKDDMGNIEVCRVEVDEVRSDTIGIKRIVGIKQIDEGAEEVGYLPIAELTFNRNGNSIGAVPLVSYGDTNYSEVDTLCSTFESNYNDWSVYHNKATVRNIINRIVMDTHPISLMPTGLCKFTPANHGDMLYSLKSALEEMSHYGLTSGASNIVEIIPIIDTDEQRNLIQKNYIVEVTDEMNSLVTELRSVLTNRTSINSRTATSYIERFKALKEKADDYGALLNTYEQALQKQLTEAIQLVNDNTATKGSA